MANATAAMNGSAVQVAEFRDNRMHIKSHIFGQILDKVGSRPVALVSINGPMRTGKSYIIGHFIRYLTSGENEDWFSKKLVQEFHWKNSSERQTTGILVWSEPFLVKRAGVEVGIILMDTQGCFDDKTSTNENSLIFALSCLLSSVLIYNFKNQLSEDILQFLQLFIGYAKMSVDEEQDSSFSKLIFLIRDWLSPKDYDFGYYDDGTSKSGKNFKTDKINVKSDMAPEVKVVHDEIISSFETVGCCLMPYPGNGLAYYDDVTQVDPLFVSIIKEFIPKVLGGSNVITKKLGGHELTGEELKKVVDKWAELFKKTEIPPVKSVAESTAEVQNHMAYTIALKFYEAEMKVVKDGDGMSDQELEGLHQRNRQEALAIFNRAKRLRNVDIQNRYLQGLSEEIQRAYYACQEINSTVKKFQEYKAESEEDRKRMKEEMEAKIREIKNEYKKKSGFFSKLGQILGECVDIVLPIFFPRTNLPSPMTAALGERSFSTVCPESLSSLSSILTPHGSLGSIDVGNIRHAPIFGGVSNLLESIGR